MSQGIAAFPLLLRLAHVQHCSCPAPDRCGQSLSQLVSGYFVCWSVSQSVSQSDRQSVRHLVSK